MKWEAEIPHNLPSNIMMAKWLPQQDLLGMGCDFFAEILAVAYENVLRNICLLFLFDKVTLIQRSLLLTVGCSVFRKQLTMAYQSLDSLLAMTKVPISPR